MLLVSLTEELSDMRKQMKALEEKNVTYMKETMNLQEVQCRLMFRVGSHFILIRVLVLKSQMKGSEKSHSSGSKESKYNA